ncbi:MAG: adenylyltransferase/cytidyltransferase family protein [Deltaproteobacteria bacterium]|nr:adenylyltransferase/cytidyltransferase family protein [Deltaproteobacteria bacterium]MBW2414073.1 adenylyltransferase/cytidyltransferase family protein [Deltaproteobacteria bacterium]
MVSARIVLDYHDLGPRLEDERSDRRTVAVANGCFDLIHVGHVRLLADARTEADVLVVALNTDESVRESKGDGRPLVPLAERMEVVAAIAGIDYVTSFPEPTAGPLLEALRPDVQIKGMDRDVGSVPERSIVERYGGRIAFCGDEKTHSSSDLARRLRGG